MMNLIRLKMFQQMSIINRKYSKITLKISKKSNSRRMSSTLTKDLVKYQNLCN